MGTPTRGAQALPSDRVPPVWTGREHGHGTLDRPQRKILAVSRLRNPRVLERHRSAEHQRLETEGNRERSPVDDAPGDGLLGLRVGDGAASISPRRFEGDPVGIGRAAVQGVGGGGVPRGFFDRGRSGAGVRIAGATVGRLPVAPGGHSMPVRRGWVRGFFELGERQVAAHRRSP